MRATIERRRGDGTAAEDLRRQVDTLQKDIRELSRLAGDAARGRVERARHAIEDELDQGRRKLNELEDKARDGVRQRPLGSVFAALGLGALLGLLLGRR